MCQANMFQNVQPNIFRGNVDMVRNVLDGRRTAWMDNCAFIADVGAIPHLVPLLSSEDPKTQENNATRVVEANAVPLLVKLITEEVREQPGLADNALVVLAVVVSTLEASVIPALVMARGHRIEYVPELLLVLSDGVEGVEKTSATVKALRRVGAFADVERAKKIHCIRVDKGKMRNKCSVSRNDPFIVYATEGDKIVKAFRNILGVEISCIDR